MDERIRQAVGDEPAWVVGGALRDELLGREIVDVDVACADPELAARLYSRLAGGAVFPLSERHGAWRVAFRSGKTVDFTPLHGNSIEEDLATRDFSVNAMARSLGEEALVDPHGGEADLAARRLRAVARSVFEDDPLRLLRAVRLEDELGFELDDESEALARASAGRVG
ncbi:MAG: CCA tRNA nucleotidyltransferase, partial [Gaiellaceae bacterium]